MTPYYAQFTEECPSIDFIEDADLCEKAANQLRFTF
jgi:hypothetical protein